MNSKDLTKQLISIPSFRDGKSFEKDMGNFLFDYLKQYFPWLKVQKQTVSKNRFNIFAKDKFPTTLLVIDHIDTVEPTPEWTKNPLEPVEKDGKIYGLGSSDTKGNIAVFLNALKNFKETKGLAMLWYVDEEYDFFGMKKFVESNLAKTINPEFVMSIDGDGLKFGRGCRGLIEIYLKLKGKTGHSANPSSGISVNRKFFDLILETENWLKNFESEFLGFPTLNIAFLQGGLVKSFENQKPTFSESGNRIPDYLETRVEIRTTNENLNFETFSNYIQQFCEQENLEVLEIEKVHDLTSFETIKEDLEVVENIVRENLENFRELDPSKFGYLDVAMLKNIYSKSKIFSFGCGTEGMAHKPDEFVEIKNLEIGEKVYRRILKEINT